MVDSFETAKIMVEKKVEWLKVGFEIEVLAQLSILINFLERFSTSQRESPPRRW